jgi:micrococcal nuclease
MRYLMLFVGFTITLAIGFGGGWYFAKGKLPFQKPAREAVRVVDGDTIKIGNESLRLGNVDAPETYRPRCEQEAALGKQTTDELTRVVNDALPLGTVGIFPNGKFDRYRRPLVKVQVNGVDVADGLIAKGLARPWMGKTSDWCAAQ